MMKRNALFMTLSAAPKKKDKTKSVGTKAKCKKTKQN